MTALVEQDDVAAQGLRATLGPDAQTYQDLSVFRSAVDSEPADSTIVLGPSVDPQAALSLAEELRVTKPGMAVVIVRRRVDTALLTQALRSGVRDVVAENDLAGLATAVARLHGLAAAITDRLDTSLTEDTHGKRGQVVTVFSSKGGCGKTTFATNLAVSLASSGRKVALMDVDTSFGDVAIAMQLLPTHTIADAVAIASTVDPSALRSLLTTHSSGVRVLAAPLDPSHSESITSALVTKLLDLLVHGHDYVIVDCPPALDERVLAAFDVSTTIALMATLDVPALKNLKLTIETLRLLNYPSDKLRLVINRADSKVGLDPADVEQTLGMPVDVRIPSSIDVPSTTNRGLVLAAERPSHPVSVAIAGFAGSALAEPILSVPQGSPGTERPAKRSIFGKRNKS